MSESVFVVTYEVDEASMHIVREWQEGIDIATKHNLKLVESVGAAGYYPGLNGDIWCLTFRGVKSVPGTKIVRPRNARHDELNVIPRRDKSGAALRDVLAQVMLVPGSRDLVRLFGWDNDYSLTNGYSVFHCVAQYLPDPVGRCFLRIPRQAGDGWEPPETIREITEGNYMRALADWNEYVAQQKSAKLEPTP